MAKFNFKAKQGVNNADQKVKPLKPKLQPKHKKKVDTPKYTDLRDIMDKSRLMTMFYSGVEQETFYNILYDIGIRNFLMSYHYVQNSHMSFKKRFDNKNISLFIDSGAHTYQQDIKYQGYDLDYWEKHIEGYLRWAERNKEYIFAIANADFENMVGGEVVNQWNKKYFEPFMLRTGLPVCFVWHQNSYLTWEQYCQRYPYIGFSSVNIESGESVEFNEYASRLNVAEKFDTLVHGFGMTQTSILPKIPYYTVDSTTWLVGLQYGEMNYWDSAKNKMTRLKKDKWQGEYLDNIVQSTGLDRQRLLDEDKEEMIKANVYPFIQAEKFIQQMHKKIIYWQKPKVTNKILENLPADFFPSPDWMYGRVDTSDYKDYAIKYNISTELGESETQDLIICMTAFLNWNNPVYDEFKQNILNGGSLIDDLHDMYINRIVGSTDDKLNDLISFFKDCLEGRDTKLLYLGTNFDRIAKERDYYIEDEEYDTLDVSQNEVFNMLQSSNLLPAPNEDSNTPEIDDLDSEIFNSLDLTPVFDERGKFVKGQRKILKPKNMYSDRYPKLSCDVCFTAQKCPEYKAGMVCAYNKMFKRYNTRNMGDVIQAMQGMVDVNVQRMQRAMIMEVMSGGMLDNNVSAIINQNMSLLNSLKQMYETASSEVIKQTRVMRSDGTYEETTQMTNPSQGGVLERLMQNMFNKPQLDADEIQADEVQNDRVVIDTEIEDN